MYFDLLKRSVQAVFEIQGIELSYIVLISLNYRNMSLT
jgi:hypothetical protein